jgi:diguanylate cyclase (GGDEF)-like protein
MRFDFILTGILFSLGSLLLGSAVYLITRKERLFGLKWFAGLTALIGLFCVVEGMSVLADGEPALLILSLVQYSALPFFAPTWFLITKQSAEEKSTSPAALTIALFAISLVFVLLNWFHAIDFIPELEGLGRWYFASHEIVAEPSIGSGFTAIVFEKGWAFQAMIAYQATLGIAAGLCYWIRCRRAKQDLCAANGGWLSLFSFALAAFAVSTMFSERTMLLDPTPFFAAVTLLFAFGWLYRNDLFDLVPRAYQLVFQSAPEPILILDADYRLVRMNAEAAKEHPASLMEIRTPLARLEPGVADFGKTLVAGGSVEIERPEGVFHRVNLEAMKNARGRIKGYLLSYRDVTVHKQEVRRLESMASLDDLTQILNRRAFFKEATSAFDSAVVEKRPLSVIMFDLDDFKDVNDIYGHQAGDYVLEQMADMFSKAMDPSCVFARYGGEEFIVFRKDKGPADSMKLAEKLRGRLEAAEFLYQKRKIKCTASFGVAGTESSIVKSLEQYIKDADLGLYDAKRQGKNRVCGR